MVVRIVGTSHIAKQSVRDITAAFDEFLPEIVAIELDPQRMAGLLSKKKRKLQFRDIFRIGIKGYLFLLFGAWAEKKLGEAVGMKPGVDMLEAIKLAKKRKLRIVCIDQNIEVTLKRLSKGISWKEKWNFLVDIFKGLILRKSEISFDLRTVPSDQLIETMISKVKKRYPNIYRILVVERNNIMAKRLSSMEQTLSDKKILAVVGAGHRKEMERLLDLSPNITYSFSIKPKSI